MTRPNWTHEEARAALVANPPPGWGLSEALWRDRTSASLATNVFRRVPARLEGIAALLPSIITGSNEERTAAMWFLHAALHDEVRAMRLAIAAVDDGENGFVVEPTPKRASKQKPAAKKTRARSAKPVVS